VGELGDGAALEWDVQHGDEAIFVGAGILDSDGTQVRAGSTLIIEAGAPWTVATTAPADGMLGPPAAEGHGVHVVRPEDAATIQFTGDATSVYFCESTCPTCRITFFLYDGSIFTEGYTGASHFHSEDEIIHVLEGELQAGPLSVVPGAAIAVPESCATACGRQARTDTSTIEPTSRLRW
jgi:hypothetical protein